MQTASEGKGVGGRNSRVQEDAEEVPEPAGRSRTGGRKTIELALAVAVLIGEEAAVVSVAECASCLAWRIVLMSGEPFAPS